MGEERLTAQPKYSSQSRTSIAKYFQPNSSFSQAHTQIVTLLHVVLISITTPTILRLCHPPKVDSRDIFTNCTCVVSVDMVKTEREVETEHA